MFTLIMYVRNGLQLGALLETNTLIQALLEAQSGYRNAFIILKF